MEEWKEIDIAKGKYEVSSEGRVRNYKTKRLITLRQRPDGYLRARLFFNGKYKDIRIHKLVATAFLPKPSNKNLVVDHINRRPYDNRASNLHWVTPIENARNSVRYAYHRTPILVVPLGLEDFYIEINNKNEAANIFKSSVKNSFKEPRILKDCWVCPTYD